MDFEEFLWAMGNDNLMDFIRKCYNEKRLLTDIMHRKVMDYYKQYLIFGGMPPSTIRIYKHKEFSRNR